MIPLDRAPKSRLSVIQKAISKTPNFLTIFFFKNSTPHHVSFKIISDHSGPSSQKLGRIENLLDKHLELLFQIIKLQTPFFVWKWRRTFND